MAGTIRLTRRAALTALGAGVVLGAVSAVLGVGDVVRGIFGPLARGEPSDDDGGMMGPGMMGNTSPVDMSRYMEMFNRHRELTRGVEEIPGGVRTVTESTAPDLVAQLQAHVSSMYSHLDQGAEVTCMSQSLPTLFGNAGGYRRQLTLTSTGVIAEETADDPALTQAIRAHAQEVTGFVREGMRAMMHGMMGPPR